MISISLFNKYRLLLYIGIEKYRLRSVDDIELYFLGNFDCLACNPFCKFLSLYLNLLKINDELKAGVLFK